MPYKLKRLISVGLLGLGSRLPAFVRLVFVALRPFPELAARFSEVSGRRDLVSGVTWTLRRGPLKHRKLGMMLPQELASVIDDRIELEARKAISVLKLEGSVVLDIGASYGFYSLLFESSIKEARIFSFEPDRYSYIRLCNNIELNQSDKIIPIPLCLGSRAHGFARWTTYSGEPWKNRLALSYEQASNLNFVALTSIDAFSSNLSESAVVGLIKIDVEGAEIDVLEGAICVINKMRPVLFIEVHSSEIMDQLYLFCERVEYEVEIVACEGDHRRHVLARHRHCKEDVGNPSE